MPAPVPQCVEGGTAAGLWLLGGPCPVLLCFVPSPAPTSAFESQVYNKIDQISMEEVDRLARKPNSVVIR